MYSFLQKVENLLSNHCYTITINNSDSLYRTTFFNTTALSGICGLIVRLLLYLLPAWILRKDIGLHKAFNICECLLFKLNARQRMIMINKQKLNVHFLIVHDYVNI